ncbi:MAG TPA: cyclic nucleotide-binding domain-containing protein [Pseudomonadales bacterium]|nr:cyclic nucleotide-binding domain-containing protein [Pseudomonadales bacterium]
MYLDEERSAGILDQSSKDMVRQLLAGLTPAGPALEFESVDNLYHNSKYAHCIFLIEEGAIRCTHENQFLYFLDEGDLIGLNNQFAQQNLVYFTDSWLKVIPYDAAQFFEHIRSSIEQEKCWTRYLLTQATQLGVILGLASNNNSQAKLGYLTFNENEVIIEEGSPAHEVYAILEGHAHVYKKGVKVGEIGSEEIFGAMALFTNTPRTATVIASTFCSVLVVPREEFKNLMQTHPGICMNLLENMAKQINSLNEQVAKLSH